MDNLSVEKYKFYLMEQLVDDHNLTELQAQRIIAKSTINKIPVININVPYKYDNSKITYLNA